MKALSTIVVIIALVALCAVIFDQDKLIKSCHAQEGQVVYIDNTGPSCLVFEEKPTKL